MNDRTIAGLQLYMRQKAIGWLRDRYDGAIPSVEEEWRLKFDVTDRPHLCLITASEGVLVAKVYLRSELGFFDEELADAYMVIVRGGEPEFVSSGRMGGDEYGTALEYLQGGLVLMELLRKGADFDTKADGVLVKLVGEAVQLEPVSGRKRPDLMCRSLFGGEQMMRPYDDEAHGFGMSGVDLFSLTEEAEEGDTDAMERLAVAHLKGDELLGIERDLPIAAYWYGKLAESGSAEGCFQFAVLLLQGADPAYGPDRALEWMERAKSLGSEDACGYVDACARIAALQGRVENGDVQAAAALAEEYMTLGSGVDDGDGFFAKCVEYARKAAEGNVPGAYWTLAMAYENGCGVEEDSEQALQCYRKGSELGHPACIHTLGSFYLSGDYLISDVDKGFGLCLQAAEMGYGPAMQTVGRCYQFGDGVPSSMKTAMEWYDRYLATHDDPVFAESVAYYKSIPGLAEDGGMELGPDFYTEYEREEFIPMADPEGFSLGMFAVTIARSDAEEYERELAELGLLPHAPMPDSEAELTAEAFPRVQMKAAEGDARAAEILEMIARVHEMNAF